MGERAGPEQMFNMMMQGRKLSMEQAQSMVPLVQYMPEGPQKQALMQQLETSLGFQQVAQPQAGPEASAVRTPPPTDADWPGRIRAFLSRAIPAVGGVAAGAGVASLIPGDLPGYATLAGSVTAMASMYGIQKVLDMVYPEGATAAQAHQLMAMAGDVAGLAAGAKMTPMGKGNPFGHSESGTPKI